MAVEITAKKVQDQLRATFYPALGMLGIMVLIFIACTRFMAKTFGAGHFLAIVFYVMLALLLLFLAMLIGRIVLIEKHPALQPFGTTEKLAERINTGLHNPRYAAYSADGNSLVTLITDDFIVSGSDFVGLLELKNLKKLQATFVPEAFARARGGEEAVQKNRDRIASQAPGAVPNAQYDYIIVTNTDGKMKRFSVKHGEMEQVLNVFQSVAPHVEIDPVAHNI
ncbi:MAG: hypothetical protein J6S92_14435 [Oscillospiraceae bacterium]|nr:hypothetical protein [Oscillospiraceae bacterium]MBQ5337872.1 hypothetical protein [Oscillospiraceae bacterium]